jgi:hypothetical protein
LTDFQRSYRAQRSVTVTARTNLSVLDASDFHMLMERDKRITERARPALKRCRPRATSRPGN